MSIAVAEHNAARRQPMLPMPVPNIPPPAAVSLLSTAKRELAQAEREPEASERFIAAYLAALRAGAALLAAKGRPHRGRAKPASVWVLLESCAPEFREWAVFFAANSSTKAAAQAGITRRVTPRAADDLVRLTGQFLELAHRTIHRAA